MNVYQFAKRVLPFQAAMVRVEIVLSRRMIYCPRCQKKRLHHRDNHKAYRDWFLCRACGHVYVESREERHKRLRVLACRH